LAQPQSSPALKGKRLTALRLAAGIGLLALAGGFLFRERILLAIGDFLIIEDALQPADVIHMIAGEDYRVEHAIALYKQGYGKILFFTGGWCEYHHHFHGQHASALALAAGVPSEAIAIDDSVVTSTYDEAERLKALIDLNHTPIRSVIVVSDPFHMRRARWTYQHVLGKDVQVWMAPVAFEETPFNKYWWIDSDSNNFVRGEYLKFIYYITRYQLSWGWMEDWLAQLDRD
jgi:uncharacterized SAM-binding protein YcdF (DUF218 family)